MKIVLINNTDTELLGVKNEQLKKIKSVDPNIELTFVPYTDKKEIKEQIEDAEIIAGHLNNIPPISTAKNLKLIQVFSAGVDRILTPEIKKSNVMIANVSGIHAIPIAEHVLGFMLNFTRNFYLSFKNQQKKIWAKNQDATEIRDKTVLVVGLGNVGKEIARLANCLGANVIGIKQHTKYKPDFVSEVYSNIDMEKVLSIADFVILSLPLTPETLHMFDFEKLKIMKKTAVIINIGRGKLINESDLIKALEQKLIAGAGLDVTEEEPLPKKSKLWGMENVIITPHQSGWSEKYMDRAIDIFCLNLKAYLKGEKLPNLIDKEKGY